MDTINQRIKKLVDMFAHGKNTEFAKILNTSEANIRNYTNEVSPKMPKFDFLNKIATCFDISTEWLLTGSGEMLNTPKPKIQPNAHEVTDINYMNIPFVSVHARAGYRAGYGDEEYISTLPTVPVIVDKSYHGKYRVFEVDGDSMDNDSRNSICDGDKVLGREIRQLLWTSKLHIRDWFFVIVTKTDGIVVKQIINHDVENHIITCHSLNPLFEDYQIDLADVAELFNVIKIVERNSRI